MINLNNVNRAFWFFLVIMLLSCNSIKKTPFFISDIENYYMVYTNFADSLKIRNGLKNKNFCYFSLGKCNVTVVRNSKNFTVFRNIPYFLSDSLKDDVSDDIVSDTLIYDLKFSLLDEIFEYSKDSGQIYYNYRTPSELPANMFFVLCDSLGSIKLIFNNETNVSTRKFYKEKLHKEIPFTIEQGRFFYELIYGDNLIYNYTHM